MWNVFLQDGCQPSSIPAKDTNEEASRLRCRGAFAMPPEIADSDEEPDAEPLHSTHTTSYQNDQDLSSAPIELDVNFDDFLTTSQHHYEQPFSQGPQIQNTSAKKSTGSTTKLLSAIGDAEQTLVSDDGNSASLSNGVLTRFDTQLSKSPSLGRNKRRHTVEMDDQGTLENGMGSFERPREKRIKTYEGRGKLPSQTQASMAIFGLHSQGSNPEDRIIEDSNPGVDRTNERMMSISTASDRRSTMQNPSLIQSVSDGDEDEEDVVHRRRHRPRRVISLLNESISDPAREVSTTRSSMGGYESINIDFRGSDNGFDANANPFNTLSQVSDQGEIENREFAKHDGILDRQQATSSTILLSSRSEERDREKPNHSICGSSREMQGGDLRVDEEPTGNPSTLTEETPDDTQLLSSPRVSSFRQQKEELSMSVMTFGVQDGTVQYFNSFSDESPVMTKTPGRKRGRPPKDKHQPSTSSAACNPVVLGIDLDQDLSQDLGTTGLLEEQYNPRPSRSRDHTNEVHSEQLPTQSRWGSTEKESRIDQGSSDKPPTSELSLSDEALVGLPEEKYKPRPSRSRSKRTMDTDHESTSTSMVPPQLSPAQYQSKVEVSPAAELKSKGKKSKVKRAKTSAAALLKKSQQMLSDGEEDVVWLDKEPVKVKLDLPPDLKPSASSLVLKQVPKPKIKSITGTLNPSDPFEVPAEQTHDPRTVTADPQGDAKDRRLGDRTSPDVTDITPPVPKLVVDVPPAFSMPAPKEPKRKGQKRKKSSELPVDENPGRGIQVESSAAASKTKSLNLDSTDEIRPALAEQDPNLSANPVSRTVVSQANGTTPSPQKMNAERNFLPERSLQKPREAAETPQKPKQAMEKEDVATSPAPAPAEKGPTKHSPINPAGGKIKYRVGLSRRAAIPSLLRIVRK